jgi:hypothetical protein
MWSTEGVTTIGYDVETSTLRCGTTHLSMFSAASMISQPATTTSPSQLSTVSGTSTAPRGTSTVLGNQTNSSATTTLSPSGTAPSPNDDATLSATVIAIIVVIAIVLLVVGVIAVIAIVKLRSQAPQTSGPSRAAIYNAEGADAKAAHSHQSQIGTDMAEVSKQRRPAQEVGREDVEFSQV